MALWLRHPRYVPTRDRLIQYLRSTGYRFRHLEPVLFLCGAAASPSRDALRDYFRRHAPYLGLFYAERVWEQIASQKDRNALTMESDLAALADLVIVIVESPGTFAELGAFSLSDPLRKKVLPIVDKQFRDARSFISTGPLKWIDTDSNFKPTIYAPLPGILEKVNEIEERISRIRRSRTVKIQDLAESPKHLLFFLCDLIAVIYPTTVEMVQYYLEQIVPSVLERNIYVPALTGLAVAMDLLRVDQVQIGGQTQILLSPAKPGAVAHPFHQRRLLDLRSQRAAHASVLLLIPEARSVLIKPAVS